MLTGHDLTSTRPSPRLPAASRRVSLGIAVVICLWLVPYADAGAVRVASEAEPIRIGFMHSIFKNQNETDVVAAMQVWATTIAEERGIRIDPKMRVYRTQSEVERALREKEIDALTLLLDEYNGLPRELIGGPFFRDETNGKTHREFVIVSRADRGLDSVGDLRGADLGVHDGTSADLASSWLNAQLADAGFGTVTEMCALVDYDSKLSAVVLGVFFGKYDAGLISREGFMAMAELNPQIATQLRVVKAAPPIIPTLFCFRTGLDSALKKRFLREVLRLHESVVGEQVLRVYKSDRMAALSDVQLERSLELLEQWKAEGAAAENDAAGLRPAEKDRR